MLTYLKTLQPVQNSVPYLPYKCTPCAYSKSALISMFCHFEGLSVVSVLGLFEHNTNINNFL